MLLILFLCQTEWYSTQYWQEWRKDLASFPSPYLLGFLFFYQEDLPSNPIRVPRSHPQWSWCVLRLLECQRIQSPSSHPKWTFQSQKGGNNLRVPITSNHGIWMCSLQLGSRKSAAGIPSTYLEGVPVPLCCSKIGMSPFQLLISEQEIAVTVLLMPALNQSWKNSCTRAKWLQTIFSAVLHQLCLLGCTARHMSQYVVLK